VARNRKNYQSFQLLMAADAVCANRSAAPNSHDMGKNAGKIPHLPQRKKNNREERRLSAGFSSNSPRVFLGIFRGSTGNCLIRLGSYSAHPATARSADKSGGPEPPSTFPKIAVRSSLAPVAIRRSVKESRA
jgi:hypothetical protein